jgi:hypothetical protein
MGRGVASKMNPCLTGEYDAWKWETRFAKLVDPDYYRGIRQPQQRSTLSEFA